MVVTKVSVEYEVLLSFLGVSCSLWYLLVAVFGTVSDRPCYFWSFLLVAVVFIACGLIRICK